MLRLIQVGDTVRKRLYTGRYMCSLERVTGKVIYVNYEHNFYTAEFEFPDGKVRECYEVVRK